MKVILAEKPSVARDIAKVLNVTNRQDGYIDGNGYTVTWAFGHLGGLAEPKAYSENPWSMESLPIIPESFKYVQKDDTGAKKQFKVIKDLFSKASEIIVATDAGREGENIFRTIYKLSGSNKPFKRLWISSLTESAIKDGLSKLRNGSDYDNLALAAEGREKADWLVGMNATIALTLKSSNGAGVLSLGRVQTPTLAIICERFLHNQNFKPEPYFVPQLLLEKNGKQFKATYQNSDYITSKVIAEGVIQNVGSSINCTKSEKKPVSEPQPLLYDLTTLQSDANKKFGFSADNTLKVMQALYETHKVLTYPRTDSRYLSEDIYQQLPKLFAEVKNIDSYGSFITQVDINNLPKRSVNDAKVSDHHAIIPTGLTPNGLNDNEQKIFDLVTRRFIAAFSSVCKKDVTTYVFDDAFKASGTVILEAGWRVVEQSIKEEGEDEEENQTLPVIDQGENVLVKSKVVLDKKTKPKPIHTEASLLKAMETAGRDIEDEEIRQAMKDGGIGTAATRASIFELLIKREYIERKKKQLHPTEKGLSVYMLVRGKKISSAELTGDWEKQLKLIEAGKAKFPDFMKGIEAYTREIVGDISLNSVSIERENFGVCPACSEGQIIEGNKAFGCNKYKEGCSFTIWKVISGKTLPITAVKLLLQGKESAVIKGFKSKAGKSFDAALRLNKETFKVEFAFGEKKEVVTEQKVIAGISWEIKELDKVFQCNQEGKQVLIYKEISNKKISKELAEKLLSGKETEKLEGFKSKAGKPFSAKLKLDLESGKVNFQFDN
jgi:DNA topoisomerase-3